MPNSEKHFLCDKIIKTMRKIFLMVLVVAGMTAMFGKFSNKEKLVDNLLLENIEALASGEGGGTWCVGTGCTHCPATGERVAYIKEPYNLK